MGEDDITTKVLENGTYEYTCNHCKAVFKFPNEQPFRHPCPNKDDALITYKPDTFNSQAFKKRREAERLARRPQPEPRTSPPTLMEKATNFNQARKQHNKAGKPKASDEQVAERFAVCSSNQCGYFKGDDKAGVCQHKKCGCGLHGVGNESMIAPNKLRWADQKCPIDLWLSVIPLQPQQEQPKEHSDGMGLRDNDSPQQT